MKRGFTHRGASQYLLGEVVNPFFTTKAQRSQRNNPCNLWLSIFYILSNINFILQNYKKGANMKNRAYYVMAI
ncbi:MAG: hypothetical protein V1709_05650 [Planctomycetota bacterium]